MLNVYRNKNQHVVHRYQMQDQTIREKKYKIIEMKLQNEEICSINSNKFSLVAHIKEIDGRKRASKQSMNRIPHHIMRCCFSMGFSFIRPEQCTTFRFSISFFLARLHFGFNFHSVFEEMYRILVCVAACCFECLSSLQHLKEIDEFSTNKSLSLRLQNW